MIRSNLIATATAAVLAGLAVAPAANAAPFATPAAVAANTSAVETVGHRHRHRHCHGCTAAAVGLGAFALGLAVAGQHQPTVVRECYIERTKRWSPRLNAYVIREEKVCY